MGNQKRVPGNLPLAPQAMENPKAVDVTAYIDDDSGIYVGVRVSRELHRRIMAEKGRRQDKVTCATLVAEALVEKYII